MTTAREVSEYPGNMNDGKTNDKTTEKRMTKTRCCKYSRNISFSKESAVENVTNTLTTEKEVSEIYPKH